MATPVRDSDGPRGVPGLPPDWPQKATERVVGLVDNVRTKTSGPAIRISRGVVYGIVAVFLAIILVPMLLIGVVRFAEVFVPGRIYLVYLGLGVLFALGAVFCWSKRPKGAARL